MMHWTSSDQKIPEGKLTSARLTITHRLRRTRFGPLVLPQSLDWGTPLGRFERLLGKGSRSRSSTQRSTFLPGSFDRSSSSASSSPLAVQVRSSFEPRVEPFPHCVLCLAPSSLPCPQQRGANLTIPARVCAQEAASASIMSIPNGRIHLGPPTGAPPRPRGLAP